MVALTNNHQQNYTSNLSVEALQDVGETLQDLNAMNQTLTQNLSSQASRLSPSDISNYEAALSANVDTQNKAMAAAASQGMNLGNNLRAASNNLVNQMMVTDILQDEVKNSEMAYEALKQNNTDKLRMIEINTYYTEKYRAQTDLMKLIIYFAIPLLLLTILANKGIISNNIAYGIGGVILFIGVIMVIMKIYDLNNRDNMNFREINVGYNEQEIKNAESGEANPLDLGGEFSGFGQDALKQLEKELGVDCIGEDCCDPPTTIWNKKYGQCITPDPNPQGTAQGGTREWVESGKGKNRHQGWETVYTDT